ncbi:ribbon-helix-helix protein, CopG family [Bradyrhizobium sp. 174]|uniref:ribbon-helix-helix protein, CopG family n=1 Tax=Bradyrhizobium sp. 174 TaxID=2782645 RepID=UPI001FFAAE4A|nr:ribbon-helix-helix protein, CopG family [Bradyrhizobium sp. 174]
MPPNLERVNAAAKQAAQTRFTALLHHIDKDALLRALRRQKRQAGAGSVTLSLKMPADLAQKLQAHAAASRLSASEVMRRAVAAYPRLSAKMAERRKKCDVRLEFASDRLVAAKLEQVYEILIPDQVRFTRAEPM